PPAPAAARARGHRRRTRRLPDRAAGPLASRGALLLMPALPLDEAGKYVAGAYVVFLVLLAVYVSIMATKLARIDRELARLAGLAERGEAGREREETRAGRSGGKPRRSGRGSRSKMPEPKARARCSRRERSIRRELFWRLGFPTRRRPSSSASGWR